MHYMPIFLEGLSDRLVRVFNKKLQCNVTDILMLSTSKDIQSWLVVKKIEKGLVVASWKHIVEKFFHSSTSIFEPVIIIMKGRYVIWKMNMMVKDSIFPPINPLDNLRIYILIKNFSPDTLVA